jgi:hypothetical protein
MKPRNTIMALIAKNDPGRYHIRSVDTENQKMQNNRSRRKAKERKEMQSENQGRDWGSSPHCILMF